MEPLVGFDEIVAGLDRLGARDRRLVAHASLASFGRVVGGANTVVDALAEVGETVVPPTFTYSPAAAAPPDDRPARNGADYDSDPCGREDPTPFNLDLEVAEPIGVIAEALRRRPGAVRSDHPLSSFAGIGRDAQRYVADHPWDDPMRPLERLCDDWLPLQRRSCAKSYSHQGRNPTPPGCRRMLDAGKAHPRRERVNRAATLNATKAGA